jgi:hypothetical protein
MRALFLIVALMHWRELCDRRPDDQLAAAGL